LFYGVPLTTTTSPIRSVPPALTPGSRRRPAMRARSTPAWPRWAVRRRRLWQADRSVPCHQSAEGWFGSCSRATICAKASGPAGSGLSS